MDTGGGPLWHSGCNMYHVYVHSMHAFALTLEGAIQGWEEF